MPEIFPGDGEMARLCRAHDWAATPLGPTDHWPYSLRTLVSTLLGSRHPMFLFWGPEHIQFYNDAYRPSLGARGGRHPAALGARAEDFWTDIWNTVEPQIRQVMEGGAATWHENQRLAILRNGNLEDVYWSYSYSPARGDDGEVEGVLVVCQETTAAVEAEARARAVAQRLTTTLESIADAILTLDSDWRVTFLNAEGERLLERTRHDLLGRDIWAEFPEAVGSTFQREYERAVRDREVVRFEEYFGPLGRWFSISAFPSEEGLAIYFQDMTERRTLETRLRERERLLGIAGRMARIGGWAADLDKGIVNWSEEVCDIHEVPHGTKSTVDEAIEFYAPEWRPVIADHFGRCAAEGVPFDLELQIVTARGRLVWVRAIGEAIRNDEGRIRRVQGAFQEIEDRKQAEAALRESDRRFRELAESMPLAVWSAEPGGSVDYQTRAMRDFTGRTAAELAGEGWFEVLHPDDHAHTAEAWTRSVETGEPYEVEFRILRRDGAWRWHLTRALPYRNAAGEILKWYGSSVDIHDQFELKRKAESLADRLTTTLESITDAFYLLSPDWRFLFVNREAERVLERPAAEILGRSIWEAFPAVVGSQLEAAYREAAREGRTASLSYFYDPLKRWFDARAYPSSEGLAVYFRDVTAQRQVEERLREQAELLDRAQDAILVRDLDHRIVFWNAGAERVYGWPRAEVLGRSVRTVLYRDPAPFDEATAAVLRDGEWTGELEHRTRDGSLVSVEGRWSLVRDEEGRPVRILAINSDLTERKRLMAQFLRAQRMESIGTRAGGIAHDLNNVLAPILLSIELIRDAVDDEELLDILKTVEGSAQRGAEMVQQVLGFARGFDRGDLLVDLDRILADLGRVVRDTFPRNITFGTRVDDDLWPMVGDPTQIHQVLMNLVVNARDAMPNGGTLRIEAANVELDDHYAAMSPDASAGPHLRISVVDSGSGIAPDVVPQIFDPFFTTKEVGKGTGLGLSTAAAIMKSHGGFLNVYSELGTGTTFRLYFPAHANREDLPESVQTHELLRGTGELVLVIDDESSIREITRQTLEAFGYRVVTATDGADAVAMYGRRGEEIALVLTDMVMPIMDGPTTIRALRHMNPEVRIVAASGLGANGGVARAADLGVRNFLPKPYTAETLLATVHRVLREP
jgi:PAS domain S-box-containing protein